MTKNKHNFVFRGNEDGRNIFEVFCLKTGGSFCTTIWELGKYPSQKCPCCHEIVENKNGKK